MKAPDHVTLRNNFERQKMAQDKGVQWYYGEGFKAFHPDKNPFDICRYPKTSRVGKRDYWMQGWREAAVAHAEKVEKDKLLQRTKKRHWEEKREECPAKEDKICLLLGGDYYANQCAMENCTPWYWKD